MWTDGAIFAGKYQIIRVLGEGGFGAVYEVEHQQTKRRLALKTLLPSFAAKPRERERFLQEARVGARIASRHVVTVEDAGVDEPSGTPWLTMELLSGEHLADLVAARGRLTLDALQALFAQLGDALGAAHNAGVIHRDLKPENLFVAREPDGRTRLTVLDFGIAQILRDGATSATVTTGIGSPLWMAPEQAMKGSRIRPATDVWAVGLLAFFALTGAYYWRADVEPAALLMQVVVGPLPEVTARAAEHGVSALPDGFAAWFGRCVSRDMGQRFADGRSALAAFAALRPAGATPEIAKTSAPPPGWVPVSPLPPREHAASQATVAIPDLEGVMAHDGGHVFGPLLVAIDEAAQRGDHDAVIRGGEQLLVMAPSLPGLRTRVAAAYAARASRHAAMGQAALAALDTRRADELAPAG